MSAKTHAAASWMKILLLLAPFVISGCYEGWEYEEDGPGEDEQPPEPPPKAPKPLLYTLIERFQLSSAALDDPLCFPPTDTKTYRTNEWEGRLASLQEALSAQSETLVTKARDVAADDCENLALFGFSALDQAPWEPSKGPAQDPLGLGRKIVHLKVVFWDEDESTATPQAAVTEVDWAAAKDLETGGIPVVSLHYFVISSEVEGYLGEWRGGLPEARRLDGTSIDVIDPSPSGLESRADIIAGDTAALTEWVLSFAQ